MKRKMGKGNKDPPNLKRMRASIEKFTSGVVPEGTFTSGQQTSVTQRERPKISRKQKRKNERILKKARKNAFHMKMPIPQSIEDLKPKRPAKPPKPQRSPSKEEVIQKNRKIENEKRKKEKKNEEDKWRRERLMIENQREDKLIKQLETSMKMNKRKKKKSSTTVPLPKAFINDGLDYLLDAVDSEKLQTMYADEEESDLDLGGASDTGSDQDMSGMEEEGSEASEQESSFGSTDSSKNEEKAEFKELLRSKDGSTSTKKVRFLIDEPKETKVNKDKKFEKKDEKLEKDKMSVKDLKKNKKSKHLNEDSDSESETKRKISDSESKRDDSDSEFSGIEDSDNVSDSEAESSDNSSESESDSEQPLSKKSKLKEDIYGRLVDDQGKVYTESEATGGAYVPPAKRLQMMQGSEKKKAELERLKKQLKGFVNRVSESNMQGISGQIEQLYLSNSRADMNECLTDILMASCVSTTITPERLAMELAMLVAVLHNNVGSEVGAYFIQQLANKFDQLQKQGGNYGDGKEIDNAILMIGHLYNFKVIQSVLVSDILKKLAEEFREKDIELIVALLKNVGFGLRKDDAATLKDVILQIQTKANSVNLDMFEDKSRVKFMLDILIAIRNNDVRKIPNYDSSHLEHLKKLLRGFIRGSSTADSQLRISLHDLVNVESKGRWWVVGSAWTGREADRTDTVSNPTAAPLTERVSAEIMDLARKQRMNTDIRRTIFCVLMTSEDFVDAFEKLLRLSLKHQQEREIIHVIVDCCLQEKRFNPYYAYLAQKFCEYDRRFQMTLQFHFWDKLKTLQTLSKHNMANLSKFLVHLFATKALSLSVLKVIEFSEMDKTMVKFLRLILLGLLVEHADYVIRDVFLRIASFPKLHILREGLKLFMVHFMLKSKDKFSTGEVNLEERIKIAEAALKSSDLKLRM